MVRKQQAKKKTGAPRPRSQLSFKRSDVTRAVRAAQDADLPIGRVEIDPSTGKIMIIAKSGEIGNNDTPEGIISKL
jgi:hypothetical protein